MPSILALLILSLVTLQASAGPIQYIDLSHDYSNKTLTWPTTAPFKITHEFAIITPAGYYCAARDFESNEHAGTHMDAPNHFSKGHPGADRVPLTDLIGPAIRVNVRHESANNPDYLIGIADFRKWETAHGKIQPGTIVMLDTGFSQYWPNLAAYSGSPKTGEASVTDMHFPGLDPEAAAWLIHERHIKAVGIDTFSIDYGQTKLFGSHQRLTHNNVPIFENVASMEKLPANDFTIYAFPMKIKDGTGAPLRIVAEINH